MSGIVRWAGVMGRGSGEGEGKREARHRWFLGEGQAKRGMGLALSATIYILVVRISCSFPKQGIAETIRGVFETAPGRSW